MTAQYVKFLKIAGGHRLPLQLCKALSQPRTAIIQAEQLDDGINISFVVDIAGDPSGFWMQIMKVGAARIHKLFANADREWDIHETIAVQMPNLSPAHPKENDATVRLDRHSRPGSHFRVDLRGRDVEHSPNFD